MKKLNFKQIGMRAAGAATGGVGGELLNTMLPNMKPMVRGIAKMALGVVVPELAPKSKFADAAGIGLAASGSVDVYNSITKKSSSGTGVQGVDGSEYEVDNDYKVHGTDEYVFGPTDNKAVGDANNAVGDGNIDGEGDNF